VGDWRDFRGAYPVYIGVDKAETVIWVELISYDSSPEYYRLNTYLSSMSTLYQRSALLAQTRGPFHGALDERLHCYKLELLPYSSLKVAMFRNPARRECAKKKDVPFPKPATILPTII
jgi:hypothetical protein